MNRQYIGLALIFSMLGPQARADDIEATASTNGSLTFVSFLTTPGPGFFAEFAPLPMIINDTVDLTGMAMGSRSGFATHNAADPSDVQPGESISWETHAMGTAGPGTGTADIFSDSAGQLLFVNPDPAPVDVRVQIDYFVTADATIGGSLASGSTFTDFQLTNPDLPSHPDLPANFLFAEFGETFSDTLLFDLTVPAASPGVNGALAVPFFSGSTLFLKSVPEPQSWALLAASLVGLLFGRSSYLPAPSWLR